MPDEAMPDEQGYNGWTNYETWAVNLWLMFLHCLALALSRN